MRDDIVTVDFDAPPVILQAVNLQGQRIGVDFSRTLSTYGTGTKVFEIAHGLVLQQNFGNEDESSTLFGQSAPTTLWECSVFDAGAATYTLTVRGLVAGASNVIVGVTSKANDGGLEPTELEIPVLVEPGREWRFTVTVDPAAQTILVGRASSATLIEADILLGCRLGMVKPEGICQSLVTKVRATAGALRRGNNKAAKRSIQALLNELRAQDSKHIQEPALTILREEAEALLKTLPTVQKLKGVAKK